MSRRDLSTIQLVQIMSGELGWAPQVQWISRRDYRKTTDSRQSGVRWTWGLWTREKSQVGSRYSKSICPTTSFLVLSLDDLGVHMNTSFITLASQILDPINRTPLCWAHRCLCSCHGLCHCPSEIALPKYQMLLSNPNSYLPALSLCCFQLCLLFTCWKCPVSRD